MQARHHSIRGKLIGLTLIMILAPVICALVVVGGRETRDIRSDTLTGNRLIGSVVAGYSAAALAFESRAAAEEALRALADNPRFLDVALYDEHGALFASVQRDRVELAPRWPVNAGERAGLEGDRITVVTPIVQSGERFGTLVLHSAAGPLVSRERDYLWGLLWLTVGIVGSSLALAWALERLVSRRLLRLAACARRIAEREDYTVRADDRGRDEIGLLADAFNGMVVEVGQRQAEAREAIRIRDEFLSVASHELRTPLTSLKLRVQSLLELAPITQGNPKERAMLHKTLELAERQVRRLEKLINDLLDVSRIAVGRFLLQRQDVDLVSLVRDVLGQFSTEIGRLGYDVELELPPAAHGMWDAMRLEQVVVNLLSNALKYGGGKAITIAVTVDDAQARLTVTDRGIGINAADQQRIFERFERAVSLDYGGLGLGLHITREIVRAHGGEIHVESEPGRGSTFVVELPRGTPALRETETAWTQP